METDTDQGELRRARADWMRACPPSPRPSPVRQVLGWCGSILLAASMTYLSLRDYGRPTGGWLHVGEVTEGVGIASLLVGLAAQARRNGLRDALTPAPFPVLSAVHRKRAFGQMAGAIPTGPHDRRFLLFLATRTTVPVDRIKVLQAAGAIAFILGMAVHRHGWGGIIWLPPVVFVLLYVRSRRRERRVAAEFLSASRGAAAGN